LSGRSSRRSTLTPRPCWAIAVAAPKPLQEITAFRGQDPATADRVRQRRGRVICRRRRGDPLRRNAAAHISPGRGSQASMTHCTVLCRRRAAPADPGTPTSTGGAGRLEARWAKVAGEHARWHARRTTGTPARCAAARLRTSRSSVTGPSFPVRAVTSTQAPAESVTWTFAGHCRAEQRDYGVHGMVPGCTRSGPAEEAAQH
jgi:hypothetical protein